MQQMRHTLRGNAVSVLDSGESTGNLVGRYKMLHFRVIYSDISDTIAREKNLQKPTKSYKYLQIPTNTYKLRVNN